MTTIPTLRDLLRATRVALLGYVITLGASLVLMGLVVLALAIGSDGGGSDDPASDLDIKAIGTLVGMPFQLAAMALGGSVRLGEGGFSMSLFAPPLLITAVFAISIFRLSRKAERSKASASTPERAILAFGSGLLVAIVATVATRVLAMREDDAVMHAATVGLFFGTLILAGVAGLLGRQAATRSLWPRLLTPDVRRAVHLVSQHIGVWIVVGAVVAVVWTFTETNSQTGVFAVVWAPTMGLAAFALGHLGALTALGQQEFAWDLGWTTGTVLLALAVVLALVAAIAWHLRRNNDPELLKLPASWLALPLAYAAAGLAVSVASTIVVSGAAFGGALSVAVHPGYWLILVLAVWGAAIEALARSVAPALVGVVPAGLAKRLARGPRMFIPAEQVTVLEPTPSVPMGAADRARAKKGLIGVGVLVVLVIAGFITVKVLDSTAYSPEHQARAYLDALVKGDVSKAVKLAPVDHQASAALLTDKVYAAAEDRITGYDITKVEKHGDIATVTVDLRGPEEGHGVQLNLSAGGNTAVFFHKWHVDEGGLAREVTIDLPDSSSSLEANGISVPVTGGTESDFWLLPGSYSLNPYGDSEWLQATDELTAVPAGDSWGNYADISAPQPSAELKQLVESKMDDWLNDCMKSKDLDPKGCPQSAYGYGDTARNVAWKLTTPPTLSWDSFEGDFPADLSSDDTGKATVTYEYDDSYGFGAPHWVKESDSSELYVTAKVDLVDGAPKVTFDSY